MGVGGQSLYISSLTVRHQRGISMTAASFLFLAAQVLCRLLCSLDLIAGGRRLSTAGGTQCFPQLKRRRQYRLSFTPCKQVAM